MDTENDPELFFDAELFDETLERNVEEEISMILTDMNLAEKVGQMTQVALSAISVPGREEIDPERLRETLVEHHVGSIFNVWSTALAPEEWHEVIATIQEVALLETRLGIPVIYGIDSVHGAGYVYGATLFPHNLGVAASWDPLLAEEIATLNARETAACGIRWVFAPVLDLGRQPLWSRFVETFGEDVHLATVMARAAANGYARLSDVTAACGKHFLGYGAPRTGHDRTAAAIPENELRDLFVPPFEAAISTDIPSIMVNSGVLNGEAVHASRRLLTGLLRDELGFSGVIVSDWEDVIKLHTVHRVAESEKEAVRIAVEAGIDVSMTPHTLSFAKHLCKLVEEGKITEERIDDSVRRILRLKHRLGLFDHPFPDPEEIAQIGTKAAIHLSYTTAVSSVTLLKNDGELLPLRDGVNLLVAGPAADSVAALHGPWSYTWQGADEDAYPEDARTLADDLAAGFGSEHVTHCKGIDWDADVDSDEAVEAARDADVVVLCLGEAPSVEKPGDIDDLSMGEIQIEFARRIAETGTPIVLVLLQDRPRIVNEIEGLCDAIVLAYRPGAEGGRAIAAVLAGAENPSAKLPFTYPNHPNGLVAYDHLQSETLGRGFGILAEPDRHVFESQYPFGFGLSYTSFSYSNLKVRPAVVAGGGEVAVTVDVSNTGSRPGREVVQLYLSDEFASVPPPVRRLKGFQSVHLGPGERRTVSFNLPADSLAFAGPDGSRRLEAGRFKVEIGGLTAGFELS
ncbi:MAG TPA: glycoside hydrolase family 3 N-terminal domain-containing protein [Rhodothermales bacterium]|nr:glycoside hydrolase family 3 N-terminal domain-containing protein [Rhodothermales bacterium]